MALLWADGFESQTALGAYGVYTQYKEASYSGAGSYQTGRLGVDTSIRGDVSGGTTTNKALVYTRTIPFTGTVIMGGAIRRTTAGYNGTKGFFFLKNNTNFTIMLQANNDGVIEIRRMNASGWDNGTTYLAATGPVLPVDSNWYYVEMKVVNGTGTSGSVTIRVNGTTVYTLTGTDTWVTTVNGAGFAFGDVYSSGASNHQLDDFYICDSTGSYNNDFLGPIVVKTIVPNGAGATTGLAPSAGSNWSNVEELPPVTSDYNLSATVGASDTYAYGDISATYDVKGVVVNTYAGTPDVGVVGGRNVLKNSTNFAYGSDVYMPITPAVFSTPADVVPGGATWTAALVNSSEFGWEIRS